MSESGYRERNSTADRALMILDMYSDDRLFITAADVAETLGVARSTAYRYLQTLVQAEFLEEDPGRGFRLGLRILQLSRLARRGQHVSSVALPAMRTLADRFRQTILLTKLSGSSVICLEREEGREQYVRLSYDRGSVLNLNAGASALVLLAWLPDDRVRELLSAQPLTRFTPATLVDPDAIIDRLHRIREDGFCIAKGEVDREAMGIAAPIFDNTGSVIAGLSTVFIESRIPAPEIPSIVEAIRRSAQELSERFQLLDG